MFMRAQALGRRRVKIVLTVKTTRSKHISGAHAAIQHGVTARPSGLVLNAGFLTHLVENLPSTGFSLMTGKEPAGKHLAAVGKHARDPDRSGYTRRTQTRPSVDRQLGHVGLNEHPTRGAIDDHETVKPLIFAVQWNTQVAETVATEGAIQAGVGDDPGGEVARDREQVIWRQQERPVQRHHHFLCWG